MSEVRAVRGRKSGRRQLQSENEAVRIALMEAARRLVAEHGFPNLRINELAEEAGVSVGTFYLYFEGKADLFVQLVLDDTERLRGRLAEAVEGGGTVLERMARRFDAYLDFVEQNQNGFRYFRDSDAVDTNKGRLSTWALDQHATDLRPLLEEGMASGELRRTDPELLAQTIVAILQHLVDRWLADPASMSRDRVRSFFDQFFAFGVVPTAPDAGRG